MRYWSIKRKKFNREYATIDRRLRIVKGKIKSLNPNLISILNELKTRQKTIFSHYLVKWFFFVISILRFEIIICLFRAVMLCICWCCASGDWWCCWCCDAMIYETKCDTRYILKCIQNSAKIEWKWEEGEDGYGLMGTQRINYSINVAWISLLFFLEIINIRWNFFFLSHLVWSNSLCREHHLTVSSRLIMPSRSIEFAFSFAIVRTESTLSSSYVSPRTWERRQCKWQKYLTRLTRRWRQLTIRKSSSSVNPCFGRFCLRKLNLISSLINTILYMDLNIIIMT